MPCEVGSPPPRSTASASMRRDSKCKGRRLVHSFLFCFNYINVLLINRLYMYASTAVVSSCCDKDKDDVDWVSRSMNAPSPFIFRIYLDFFPHIFMSGYLKVCYKHFSTYNNAHTLTICITGRPINEYSNIVILWTLVTWLRMTKTAIESDRLLGGLKYDVILRLGGRRRGVNNTTTRPTGTTTLSFVWPICDDDHSIDSPMTTTNTTRRALVAATATSPY